MTVILLGELDKFVPISPQRVSTISIGDSDIQVTLRGTPGEKLDFYLGIQTSVPGAGFGLTCQISDLGVAILSIADLSCY